MHLIRTLTGGLALLCLPALLTSCIAIYPGAFPRLTPAPAARADGADTLVSDLAAAVNGRSNNVLQPIMGGSYDSASLFGGIMEPGPMLPTDVRQVLILRQTGIFDDPSGVTQRDTTMPGQEYAVRGVSPDGQWWEVACLSERGSCWISANPVFVQPVTGLQPSAAATPAPLCSTATPQSQQATPEPQQASAPQTLNFVDDVAVVQGTAGFNQPQVYLFFGAQGQNIRVQLSSQPAGANFEVASQDNNTVYKSFADPSLDWSYVLPASQNYRVTVNSVTPVVFTLTVTLRGSGGGDQHITFAPGQTNAQVSGTAGFGQSPQFVFFANGGQQVRIVVISSGNVANFGVTGVIDGVTYKSLADPTRDWTFTLPSSQDYQITVTSPSPVAFMLQIDQQDLERPVERITFAPGQSTVVTSGVLEADVLKHYVVFVAACQQLRVLVTSNPAGSANFAINGVSDGIVYKPLTDPSRETTITAPVSQDYLITIFSSVNASYQIEVTIPTPLPPTPSPLPTLMPPSPPVQSVPSLRELKICCDNKDKLGTGWCCNLLYGR